MKREYIKPQAIIIEIELSSIMADNSPGSPDRDSAGFGGETGEYDSASYRSTLWDN